jgi:hypothetical protein
MNKTEIESFLVETAYCDYSHPLIQNEARKHKDKYRSQRELARALFYFVRDYTHYRVGNWNCKASETFLEKGGTCTNNANLLVALCRALGIPAGYGVMEVVGPDYFGPIILESFSSRVSKKTKHVYAFIYLDGRWIKCDPSDDEPLSLNTQHINPQSKVVEWNGISDAILNLNPSHIISDNGPFDNIDHLISKRQRRSIFIPVRVANLYISFLRQHGSKIKTIEELEPAFMRWLRKKNMIYYLFYSLFLKIPITRKEVVAESEGFDV